MLSSVFELKYLGLICAVIIERNGIRILLRVWLSRDQFFLKLLSEVDAHGGISPHFPVHTCAYYQRLAMQLDSQRPYP